MHKKGGIGVYSQVGLFGFVFLLLDDLIGKDADLDAICIRLIQLLSDDLDLKGKIYV